MNNIRDKQEIDIERVTRVEERLAIITEKILEQTSQMQSMWKKMDSLIEGLIKMKALIEQSQLTQMNQVVQDVALLKAWKDSIWRFAQPAFSAVTGAVIGYFLTMVLK